LSEKRFIDFPPKSGLRKILKFFFFKGILFRGIKEIFEKSEKMKEIRRKVDKSGKFLILFQIFSL